MSSVRLRCPLRACPDGVPDAVDAAYNRYAPCRVAHPCGRPALESAGPHAMLQRVDALIPNDFIQTLLSRVDIVEVVDRLVPLKKAGANYVACCPFHGEKTPSFTVSPTKQFYHCFGCGAHGTAIGFLMEYSQKSFPEAVEELARDAGLTVPRVERSGEKERREEAADLTEQLLIAAKFYRVQLKESQRAIDYLKGRGLTGTIAAHYGIGYAPDAWQSLDQAFPDYSDPSLDAAGLVVRGESNKRYDRFRDRVMFPIHDVRGRVVGFGGRVLDRGEPKYLNSPETPVFSKGRELYGLFQARQAIRDAERVVVVEGYMDVVALAQHGVGYAVATLGTSTTAVHVQKLFRLTDSVVFCFDGDNAGRKAAWRALENALPALADGKNAQFLFLPDGEDPDDFVRKRGQGCVRAGVEGRGPALRIPASRAGRAASAVVGRRSRRAGRRRTTLPRADRSAGAGSPASAPARGTVGPAGIGAQVVARATRQRCGVSASRAFADVAHKTPRPRSSRPFAGP